MDDHDVADALKKLEDALAPYGYYFGEGKDENALRLTFVELGLFALEILVWGITEYAKGIISQRAKKDADRIFGGGKPKEEDLRRQLDEVVADLRHLKERLHATEEALLQQIGEDRLVALFQNLGMSSRGARQAAIAIRPVLATEVAGLLSKEHP